MPKYLLTFHGEMNMEDMPSDPEAQQAVMAEWGAWYGTMGEALVDGGAPISMSAAIDADGGVDSPAKLTGYTIIDAADMAAATEISKGCPVIANGHAVQISECIDMGMDAPS
ncbi:MAG: hypothetical protein ACR2QO_23625 [Acidimicrobiales bacterium]